MARAKSTPVDPSEDLSVGPEGEALVLVQKDGEDLFVNPACVGAHVEAGWKIAE